MTLINNKKKFIFVLVSIFLVFAILASAVCFLFYMTKNYGLGVITKISVKTKSIDTMELRMKYLLPSGGYSVRVVPEDEGEYIGDGMIEYDGALGEHRIIVEFGDVDLHRSYKQMVDENGVIKLSEDVRVRYAHPSDHGVVIYFGFDTPIGIETIGNDKLNLIGGMIKIPITVENQ